jgi:hypothetical protein
MPPREGRAMTCSIAECQKATKHLGLCYAHYSRLKRHGDPLAGDTFFGEPMKFFEQIPTYQSDECLLWPYAKGIKGYGRIRVNGKHQRVSRLVCQRIYGDPPSPRHEAAHSCRTPACVNPRHLRWATPEGNEADKIAHGTHIRGERQWKAKLTVADVLAIRVQSQRSLRDLAREYGVHNQTIHQIRRRESWAWL